VSQEKIPIENVINILKKYQHLMKDSSYIVENFKVIIKTENGDDYAINLQNLEFKFSDTNDVEIISLISIDEIIANLKISTTMSNNSMSVKGSITLDKQPGKLNKIKIGQTSITTDFKINFDTTLSYLNFLEKVNFNWIERSQLEVGTLMFI